MNMNTQTSRLKTSLVAAAVASVLAGCASSPAKPADAFGGTDTLDTTAVRPCARKPRAAGCSGGGHCRTFGRTAGK